MENQEEEECKEIQAEFNILIINKNSKNIVQKEVKLFKRVCKCSIMHLIQLKRKMI
jgi:hypothetical protein